MSSNLLCYIVLITFTKRPNNSRQIYRDFPNQCNSAGFSLIEVIVTLAIIGILTGLLVSTLAGVKQKDKVDRAVQQIYDDLVFIRSRSISTNVNHRLSFVNDHTWQLEQFNSADSTWSVISDVRFMPSDTHLTTTTFANAGSNLQATPRGLFQLVAGAVGTPYVTVETLGYDKTKSIKVDIGGALEITLD